MQASYAAAGAGRINLADADLIVLPAITRANPGPGLVLVHSSGGSVARSYMNAQNDSPAQTAFARALSDRPLWPLIASDMGGAHTFGNQLGRDRIDQAIAHGRTNSYASSGKFVVIGSSQGSATALSYAMHNPTLVAALILILTVPDMEYLREQNADGTVRGIVDTDWGVTYPALLPADGNSYSSTLSTGITGVPVGLRVPAVKSIPMRSYYVSDDLFTPLALEQELVTAWGPNGSGVNLGALGHSDAAVGAIDVADLTAWLQKNVPTP